jgi:hypothetical protein
MKNLHLALFILIISGAWATASAQVCTPDSTYQDSTAGVYPKPLSEENPDGGINVPACIGEDYEFNLTVVVPDTVVFGGIPLVIRRIRLRTNNPVQGLPNGINFACEPSTCDMPANTLGCIVLNGIADESNEPKDYPLVILVDLVTSFAVIPTQFPNTALAPGEYLITVKSADDPECLASIKKSPQKTAPVQIAPNPGSDNLMVYLPLGFSGQGEIHLLDQNGRIVYREVTNRLEGIWELPTATLPAGFYTVFLKGDRQLYQAKYVKL